MLLASLLCISVYPLKSIADGVVLWNTLGNQYEVTHSGLGPNGIIQQGDAAIVYAPVTFGNGIHVPGVEEDPNPTAVTFNVGSDPSYSGNKGTMAFWVKPNHDSNYFGNAGWINILGPDAPPFKPNIYWQGWDQTIRFHICALPFTCALDDQGAISVPSSNFAFQAGDIFHVALVWDRDGIDGTSDTMRAYINATLYGAKAETWDADQQVADLLIGKTNQAATIDNLVIWNYAKTDFSDRFDENPVGKTFSTFTPSASMKLGAKLNDDSFKVSAKFGLGAESDGIDPVSEKVNITMGSFSATIPAGEFQQQGSGLFTFKGTINKVDLKAQINIPQSSSGVAAKWFKPKGYWFKLEAMGADLDGTVVPPEVKLTIGDDTGQAKLNGGKAEFGQGKDDEHKDNEQWLSHDDQEIKGHIR